MQPVFFHQPAKRREDQEAEASNHAGLHELVGLPLVRRPLPLSPYLRRHCRRRN
jgi:hypothetical protein